MVEARSGIACVKEALKGTIKEAEKPLFYRRQKIQRINQDILAKEVRLIGENGEQLGVFLTKEALFMAQEKDLDLVEVARGAVPPVAKLADAGKLLYQANLKAREAKKHQQKVLTKEIKFRPRIEANDYETKKKHIVKFLEEGDRVKVSVTLKGREQTHPEVGKRLLDQLVEDVKEYAMVDLSKLDGRTMLVTLVPLKK